MRDSHHPPSPDPQVTCVIIFLNEERFLREAILSVLSQTHEDWELLLVDDGSTDGSGAIARQFAHRHPDRIRYLCHEARQNRGMSASRNLGLRHARGRLLAYLDGDDVWLPDKLERQVGIFDAEPDAQLVCGSTEYWFSWDPANSSRDDWIRWTGEVENGPGIAQDRLYAPGELFLHLFPVGLGNTPSSSGYFIRRDFAVAIGGFEDSFSGMYEDQVFVAKAALNGPVFVSGDCFERYRQHAASCMHTTPEAERIAAKRDYLKWLVAYLARIGFRDRHVIRRLQLDIARLDHPRLFHTAGKAKAALRKLVASRTRIRARPVTRKQPRPTSG